jgi:hypothetical protein
MLMNKGLLSLIILIIALLASCPDMQTDMTEEDLFYIASPKAGWEYYNDRTLFFSMNTRSNNITWESNLDGLLGSGNNINIYLTAGMHGITAHYNAKKYIIFITVTEKTYNNLDEKRRILNESEIEITLSDGRWSPGVITLDGTLNSFTLSGNGSGTMYRMNTGSADRANEILRDIIIRMPETAKPGRVIPQRTARSVSGTRDIGEKKTFFVANTLNTSMEPHELEGEIIYIGERFTVWKTGAADFDTELLKDAIAAIDGLIIPRVTRIWGDWSDIDGDNRIGIVFCHTINDEGIAAGFFNDSDFYARNNDKTSAAYNPYSNEMDMVYAAMPDKGNNTYSPETIYATIAHEITHAINYTYKTYQRYISGAAEVPREDIFIDEGWSHLSENLCGFGISGGNIYFLKKYFEDMATYSYCGANKYGQYDSAGMRGAMTLFLSWLFWKQGGMNWIPDDNIIPVDRGGIAFLRRMARLDSTGWESAGEAFGRPVDELFIEFVYELNRRNVINKPYISVLDPYTGQPVEFFSYMQIRNDIDGSYIIIKPKTESRESLITLLPWSFCFIEPISFNNAGYIKATVKNSTGRAMVSFVRE